MAKTGTTRAESEKQEKRINRFLGGGYRPPNSGATDFIKGDVLFDDLFLDGKTAMKPVRSKTVKLEELEKAKEQAFYMRKEFYALVISFGDGKDYYLLEDLDFRTIYEGYKKYMESINKPL